MALSLNFLVDGVRGQHMPSKEYEFSKPCHQLANGEE